MLFSAEWEKFIWEGLIFLTYFLICGALTERRFSKTVSLLTAGGTVAVIVSLQTAASDSLSAGNRMPAHPVPIRFLSDHGYLDSWHRCVFYPKGILENPHAFLGFNYESAGVGVQFAGDGLSAVADGAYFISGFPLSSQTVPNVCVA